jgi:hypothetical protein
MAGVGLVSTSRPTTLGPVFVTPVPASTDAAAALPKLTAGGDAAPALLDTEAMPTVESTTKAPSAEILRTAREVAVAVFIGKLASSWCDVVAAWHTKIGSISYGARIEIGAHER